MWTVTLKTLGLLDMTYSSRVTPLPTILALWYTWVYVGSLYSSDEASDIKASVDDFLSIWPTLSVPNVNPNDGHVRFVGNLNDMRLRCEDDVIKDMVALENAFNIVWGDTRISILAVVRDAYDFEIRLGLQESRGRDLFCIRGEWQLCVTSCYNPNLKF